MMTGMAFHKTELKDIKEDKYKDRGVGCLVLSHDQKIVVQLRDAYAPTSPNCIDTFGGGIKPNENPQQALVRELNEELGAIVKLSDVVKLGAIIETNANHQSLVYMYFWYDRYDTITGCYEGKAKYINDSTYLDTQPKVADCLAWVIEECKKRRLIK